MQFIKSLQRTNSFKTHNVEDWTKKEIELYFRSIGLEPFIVKIFSKQNPLFSSLENGEMFLYSINTIFNNVDLVLNERSNCVSVYDPYAKLDGKTVSFLVKSVSHLLEETDLGLHKVHELEGMIGTFLQLSVENQITSENKGTRPRSNSKTKPSAKFDSIPTHPIIKQRLNTLNLYMKLQRTYFDDLAKQQSDSTRQSSSEMTSASCEDENDFYNFQQNFILDHFIALQFFRNDPTINAKIKPNTLSSTSESNNQGVEDFQFICENLKFGHIRKLSIQFNNLRNNVNHFDEQFISHEKNKGSKSLFFTSNDKGGFFVSQSFESMEAAFIGIGVDCRLLTVPQVIEYIRYKRIMKKSTLLQIIDLHEIDGQVFVTMRDPLEWKVLLYPYRNEIPEVKTGGNAYECICKLATALSNVVKVICKNNYKLGGNAEPKEYKQLQDIL